MDFLKKVSDKLWEWRGFISSIVLILLAIQAYIDLNSALGYNLGQYKRAYEEMSLKYDILKEKCGNSEMFKNGTFYLYNED